MAEMECPILPTETNEIEPRLTAVSDELTFMMGGNTPAFLLSPRCRLLRKGFVSDYKFKKIVNGTSETTADKPDKTNPAADPHDALQYALLGKKGRAGVVGKKRDSRAKADPRAEAVKSGVAVIKDGGMNW